MMKAESALHLAEVEAAAGAWDGEVRQVSKHSATLTQLDNGVKVTGLIRKQKYPFVSFHNVLFWELHVFLFLNEGGLMKASDHLWFCELFV